MVANYQPKNGVDIKEFEACTARDLEVERLVKQEPYLSLHARALLNGSNK